MQRNFDKALAAVLKHEGGYVNHRADPGGPTNLGVTLGTAKRLGIDVDGDGDTDIIDIKLLKPADAAKVYRAEYWNKVKGDQLPDGVDYAVFDFAVNSGPKRAIQFLQKVVGAQADGIIGPATMRAVLARSATVIVKDLCAARLAWLKTLGTFDTFGRGWTTRVSGVESMGIALAVQPPEKSADPYPKPIPVDPAFPPIQPAPPPPSESPRIAWGVLAGWGFGIAFVLFALYTLFVYRG